MERSRYGDQHLVLWARVVPGMVDWDCYRWRLESSGSEEQVEVFQHRPYRLLARHHRPDLAGVTFLACIFLTSGLASAGDANI